ncbi:hypothetical protein CEXT_337021 [Caerostris extrusa]|uniref:Uncharacterized protein n=1 Tax=Caerostris extrusa TaxID=172846 RepID=A0AAV4XTZ9_CAEEX|nr:hypothetical protein CEXT_337021 [Caerostris extrusa]
MCRGESVETHSLSKERLLLETSSALLFVLFGIQDWRKGSGSSKRRQPSQRGVFSPVDRREVIRERPLSCFEVCGGESAETHSLSKEDCHWKRLPFSLVCAFRHSGLEKAARAPPNFSERKRTSQRGCSQQKAGSGKEGPLSCFEVRRGENPPRPIPYRRRTATETSSVFSSVFFGIRDWRTEERGSLSGRIW